MTATLHFVITFHTPFHIATGEPGAGFDQVVDRAVPLPASSLKGVMKGAATRLGVDKSRLATVFGSAQAPSPWAWSDGSLDGVDLKESKEYLTGQARIKIAEDGLAEHGFLKIGQQVHATTATFTIEQTKDLEAVELAWQRVLLRASARAVLSLGGERRRGSGWVTINEPAQRDWTAADTSALQLLMS